MQSITHLLRRLAGRAGPGSGRGLEPDEVERLWGAVLDGGVPDLELGAILATLASAGPSTDELSGLHRALLSRSTRWSPLPGRRVVSIPVYGLAREEAAFAVLLAAFLRRIDVPVVLHGPLESSDGPSAAALLRELGVLPGANLADAERELREHGIAFVPTQLLSPGLAMLVALRARLAAPNAAHVAACVIDPGGMGALRVVSCVPGTPSAHVAPFLRTTEGDALLLSWPEPGVADLSRRPRVTHLASGAERLLFESEAGAVSPPLADPAAAVRAVAARAMPVPLPLVQLAAACLVATGSAPDLSQAKAVVALQSGRLAA